MAAYSSLKWECETDAEVTMEVCFDHFTSEVTEWTTTIGLTDLDSERDVLTVAGALEDGRQVVKEWLERVMG